MDQQARSLSGVETPHADFQDDRAAQKRLLIRLLERDPEAQQQFVSCYEHLCYHIFRSMEVPRDDWEDLRQQVFVHLWDRDCHCLRRWQGEGKMGSYLYRVIVRITCDYKRRRLQAPRLLSEAELASLNPFAPADQEIDLTGLIVRQVQAEAINRELGSLPVRDREVVWRKHGANQTYREIAAAMGLTVNHVGVILLRTERRLRERLQRGHPELFGEEE